MTIANDVVKIDKLIRENRQNNKITRVKREDNKGEREKRFQKNRKKCLTKERREGIIKKLTAPAAKVIEKRIETYHKTWKNQKFRQKSEPE